MGISSRIKEMIDMTDEVKKDMALKYQKGEVICLARGRGNLYFEERTIQKWLDNIIEFLNSSRAQKVLEWHKEGDRGDYFLNEEMNINHSRNSHGKSEYNYNIITAITLSTLLMVYEEDYFQALLKGEYAPVKEGELWMDDAERKIAIFRDYWNEKLDEGILVEIKGEMRKEKRSWEIISINILSQLYKLTLPEINSKYIAMLEKDMQELTDKFLSLDGDSKNKAYGKIKTRLKYIDKQIDGVIEDMTYEERFEYNTNLQLKKGVGVLGEL